MNNKKFITRFELNGIFRVFWRERNGSWFFGGIKKKKQFLWNRWISYIDQTNCRTVHFVSEIWTQNQFSNNHIALIEPKQNLPKASHGTGKIPRIVKIFYLNLFNWSRLRCKKQKCHEIESIEFCTFELNKKTSMNGETKSIETQ